MLAVTAAAASRPLRTRSGENSRSSSVIAHRALNSGSSGPTASPERSSATLEKRTPSWRRGRPAFLESVALMSSS